MKSRRMRRADERPEMQKIEKGEDCISEAAGTSAKEEGELWRNPRQSAILERKRLSGWIEDENMIREESINQGFSPGPKPDHLVA